MTNQLFRDYLDGKITVRTPKQIRHAAFMQAAARAVTSLAAAGAMFSAVGRAAGILEAQAQLMALGVAPARTYPPPAQNHPGPNHLVVALAAKAVRSQGPPASVSWRGRERTTKFRSQS